MQIIWGNIGKHITDKNQCNQCDFASTLACNLMRHLKTYRRKVKQVGHLRKYLKCTQEKNMCFSQSVTNSHWLCILSSQTIQPVWLRILLGRIFWENIWNKQYRKRTQAPKAGRCESESKATKGYWSVISDQWSCVAIGQIGLIEWIGWILWIGWIR